MSILAYILVVNAVFGFLFGAYLLLLKRETFFLANRLWLVCSALFALVVPLLPTPALVEAMPAITLPIVELEGTLSGSTAGLGWWDVLMAAYVVGVLIGLVRLILEARSAWEATKDPNSKEGLSFFWRVAIPDGLQPQVRDAMWEHERTHVRQGHSLDILLFRALQVLSWFIPIWGFALRELRLVHEHTADAEARVHHENYEEILLAHAFGVPQHVLTNSFRSSDLKLRMTMMHRSPSNSSARTKYLIAVPLVLLTMALTAPTRSAVPFRAPQSDVVMKADQMPEFPGGMDALVKYIGENVKYPKSADGEDVPAGTVHVQFIVAESGAVEKVSVKKGSSIELDMEAIRVIRSMPKWNPGKNDGKPVPVQMVLPIRFEPS